MGSIPTRSRHLLLTAALAATLLPPLAAQDTTRVRQDTTIYRKAPVSPGGAFLRSFLVPGWGQAALDRRLTAGLFIAWEGVTVGMAIKSHREVRYLKRIGSARLGDKRQEREDWLVLVAFNHLFAALEGFVGSHLWDFPDDVRLRVGPVPGGFTAAVALPFRMR